MRIGNSQILEFLKSLTLTLSKKIRKLQNFYTCEKIILKFSNS